MKALILDNKVVDVKEEEFPVHPSLVWSDCPDNCEPSWILIDGILQPPPVIPKTKEELIEEYKNTLESKIDTKAQEKNYKNGFTCATYINSTNQQWKNESQAFIAWRDSVWIYALDILEQVENNQIPAPTIDEFINNAPQLNW